MKANGTPTPGPARGQRQPSIEFARYAACVGIVFFHTTNTAIGYAGLPLLTAISVAFAVRTKPGTPWRSIVGKRLVRLGLPFVFWACVFAALKAAQAIANGEPIASEFERYMLLTGPALHLWWLPYAIVATSLAAVLASRGILVRSGRAWAVTTALAAASSLGAAYAMNAGIALPYFGRFPLDQWVFTAPSVALGLAAATVPNSRRGLVCLLVACGATAGSAWLPALLSGADHLAVPYTIAAAALALVWRAPAFSGRLARAAVYLGSLSYAVYLVHPAFIALLPRFGLADERSLLLAGLASVAATIAAVVIVRTPVLKRFA